jgi:hypothetical protein
VAAAVPGRPLARACCQCQPGLSATAGPAGDGAAASAAGPRPAPGVSARALRQLQVKLRDARAQLNDRGFSSHWRHESTYCPAPSRSATLSDSDIMACVRLGKNHWHDSTEPGTRFRVKSRRWQVAGKIPGPGTFESNGRPGRRIRNHASGPSPRHSSPQALVQAPGPGRARVATCQCSAPGPGPPLLVTRTQ